MAKMLLVMRQEIRASLQSKTFLFFALGLPLILAVVVLVVILVNRDAAPGTATPAVEEGALNRREGYVDPGDLIEALPSDLPAGWLTEYPDEAAAQVSLKAGEIGGYYVVAADYVQTGQITYVRLRYNPISNPVHTEGIQWVLDYNLLGDAELAARVRQPLQVHVTALESGGQESEEESWITELLPNLMALVLYMSILIPSGMLVNAVTNEKKNRVMEVLLTSVSSRQMIAGKLAALGLLGLVQTAMWMGVMWAVARFGGRPLNVPAGFELPRALIAWTFVYGLLGYAMYGAQMAGLGALAPELKDARGATFLIMLPMIISYTFLVVILEAPDGLIALALSLFPLSSPVAMITRMTATQVPAWQPPVAAVLQMVAVVIIVRAVARMFRAQVLLSGQPFSVGRYLRAFLGRA